MRLATISYFNFCLDIQIRTVIICINVEEAVISADSVNMKIEPTSTPRPARRTEQRNAQPPAVSAELLFCGAKEIVIRHQGDEYRLRITRNDKLILTK